MAAFLLATGGLSMLLALLLGRGAAGIGSTRFLPSARTKLLFVLLLTAGLVLANVGFMAYLMFISSHDLTLLALLLAFAMGTASFSAVVVSRTFNSGLESLVQVVRAFSRGDLAVRAQLSTADELEELSKAFNEMAQKLETASERQKQIEEARRNLVAAVSHDLRTPLASLRAMMESLDDGIVTDAKTVQRYLHNALAEIGYLTRLIDDLFELSQIDSGQLQLHRAPASVADLISDTLEMLTVEAHERRLNLKGELGDALPAVVMDTSRMQRVLYNLTENAVRHTPEQGTVIIRAVDAGADVRVSVIDTGEGISAEDLPRIFDRFDRGGNKARRRDSGGSGLGLTIARGIVELHGGRIWAQSREGEGATFSFTIPKTESAALPT